MELIWISTVLDLFGARALPSTCASISFGVTQTSLNSCRDGPQLLPRLGPFAAPHSCHRT